MGQASERGLVEDGVSRGEGVGNGLAGDGSGGIWGRPVKEASYTMGWPMEDGA